MSHKISHANCPTNRQFEDDLLMEELKVRYYKTKFETSCQLLGVLEPSGVIADEERKSRMYMSLLDDYENYMQALEDQFSLDKSLNAHSLCPDCYPNRDTE